MSQSKHTPGPRVDVCGCRVARLAGVEQFVRCPAHEAGPDLLAVLGALVSRADAARADGTKAIYLSTGEGGDVDDMRAAIARAKGES